MMQWIVIAAVCMAVVSVAHQTGFVEKAYTVCGDVARCSMCATFWATLFVLIYMGCRPLQAAALSFAAAYFSNWCGLLLWLLAKWYDSLWQKIKKTHPRKTNR